MDGSWCPQGPVWVLYGGTRHSVLFGPFYGYAPGSPSLRVQLCAVVRPQLVKDKQSRPPARQGGICCRVGLDTCDWDSGSASRSQLWFRALDRLLALGKIDITGPSCHAEAVVRAHTHPSPTDMHARCLFCRHCIHLRKTTGGGPGGSQLSGGGQQITGR